MSLRSEFLCPVFGHGRVFKTNVLPSYEDVMLCYLFISRSQKNKFKNSVTDTSFEVSNKLLELWRTASIPTIEHRSVMRKIKNYYDKYINLIKPYKSRKGQESYKIRIEKFKSDAQKLFDIAACKCENFDSCICEMALKVPVLERVFLIDQRTVRKMGIGATDVKNSMKITKRIERKLLNECRANKKKPLCSDTQHCSVENGMSSNKKSDGDEIQLHPESVPCISPETLIENKKQKMSSMITVAQTADRYGISDRAAAALVSATLQDVGLITKTDLSNVVDRNSIRRSRALQRSILSTKPLVIQDIFGLYFDGRKDKTMTMVDSARKIVSEEHISLVKEPNSEYIGHISVESGKSKFISNKIIEFLNEKGVDCNYLVAVGCDGTVVNTGVKGGVVKCLEEMLHKPLQWFICQLHANELPLRHLFEFLDGSTSGPKSFTGQIGKDLKDCENLPIVNFTPINSDLPDISNEKDLSTDQLYLFDICNAIKFGHCNDSLRKRSPGKIVHSRWLTMANRILRVYVSKICPTESLLHMVNFILKVYAPMWFSIKTRPSCIYGSKHLHQTIVRSRYLPDNLKQVVDTMIQRNGFFGHAENMLLAMLADERDDVKVLALQKIIICRNSPGSSLRVFKVPTFDFNTDEYTHLIDWNDVTVTEPPLISKISDDVLNECIQTPFKVNSLILPFLEKFPNHSQATERCVKIVTEAAAAVCGEKSRDGFIRTRLESRKIMPVFNSKKDYNVL